MSTTVKFQKKYLAVAIASATLIAGQPLQAQDRAVLEEVIVTATARSQSTQDIPFNITAVQGDDIAAQHIVDTADLMRTIPGVTLIDRGYRNAGIANSLVIRGLNVDSGAAGDIGNNTVPTVSTYVDSTPVFANFILKDIDRVEVLRGPQGTLYGSGSLGGTVRYIMNKPNMDELGGKFNTSYSQTDGSDGDNVSFDGVINIPINDQLAVRASGGQIKNDGVIDYVNLYQLDGNGVPVVDGDGGDCISIDNATNSELTSNGSCYGSKKDADDVDIWFGRVSVLYQPSDELSVQLNYQKQHDEVGARRAVTNGIDGWGDSYGDYENGSTMLEPSERDVELANLEVEVDLGFATLTSNTSHYESEGSGWRDNTSLWVSGGRDWFDAWYTGMPRPVAHVEAGMKEEANIQEFRLVSNPQDGDKIDWVAGVYYMDQDRETSNYSHLLGLVEYGEASGWWLSSAFAHDMDFTLNRKETFTDMAAYGELTYHLNDTLRVTGGLRWFDNELTNKTAMNALLGQPANIPYEDYPTQKEDDVLVKFNVSWDVSESAMLYATYSEGFRRGGPNSVPTNGAFAELNPETVAQYGKDDVKNYEIGIKGGTDRIRYSADIYYVDWQGPQLNTATAWWGFFMAQNGDSARTQGFELELEAVITDNLNVIAGYSYTDAELTGDLIQPQTGAVISEDGHELPGTPQDVVTLGLNHTTTVLDNMTLSTRVNGYYQSSSLNYITDGQLQEEHDGFSLWNFSSTLMMEHWSVSLFAKNIFNEEGVTGSYPSAYMSHDTGANENYFGNNQRDYISSPRTVGMSVGYEF
jgi:outer membrane receptor protein involved in Fe transport